MSPIWMQASVTTTSMLNEIKHANFLSFSSKALVVVLLDIRGFFDPHPAKLLAVRPKPCPLPTKQTSRVTFNGAASIWQPSQNTLTIARKQFAPRKYLS